MRLILIQPELSISPDADNFEVISSLLSSVAWDLEPSDVLLLPEHWELGSDRHVYLASLRALAKSIGCHIVGGSQHELRDGRFINSGAVVNASGEVVTQYEKLRPYARELERIDAGERLGEFQIGAQRIAVLVCADFWFSDIFYQLKALPDLVLVPALSVTRKGSGRYSQNLWRHLSIARAYEFGVYIGIADWAAQSELAPLRTAGAAGFADPTQQDPARFFTPVDSSGILVRQIHIDQLAEFRRDRLSRGFFWKKPLV